MLMGPNYIDAVDEIIKGAFGISWHSYCMIYISRSIMNHAASFGPFCELYVMSCPVTTRLEASLSCKQIVFGKF